MSRALKDKEKRQYTHLIEGLLSSCWAILILWSLKNSLGIN